MYRYKQFSICILQNASIIPILLLYNFIIFKKKQHLLIKITTYFNFNQKVNALAFARSKKDKYVIDTSSPMRNHRIPWRRNRKYRRFFDHGIELDPINSPLVLEDTIESVKSVRPKESSPNSISRNHSIEPMVHPPSSLLQVSSWPRWKEVETFRNKNWSRYHRSPHWSKVQGGDERRVCSGRGSSSLVSSHVEKGKERKGKGTRTKEQNEFHQVHRFYGPTFKILPPSSSGWKLHEQISPASTPSPPPFHTPGPHVPVYFISARFRNFPNSVGRP